MTDKLKDVLKQISDQIHEQVFTGYDLNEYIDLLINTNPNLATQEYIMPSVYYVADSYWKGSTELHTVDSMLPRNDIDLKITPHKVFTWRAQAAWNALDVLRGENLKDFDLVAQKIISLKKSWDLGLQEAAFMGSPYDPAIRGLLNYPGVPEAAEITLDNVPGGPDACFEAIVDQLLPAYMKNSGTVYPDTLIVPAVDYHSWGGKAHMGSGLTKLDYIQRGFTTLTRKDFKVLPCMYADKKSAAVASLNGRVAGKEDKGLYVLYNRSAVQMQITCDFTLEELHKSGDDFIQKVHGAHSGAMVVRPEEILYVYQELKAQS